MPYRYIIADTETTGSDANAKVVELAWVEVDDDLNIVAEVSSLIDPQIPIPASASGIHGIEDHHVEHEPTIEEFFYQVHDNPLQGDVILAAHNVNFDLRFLKPFIPSLHSTLCTLRLARRYFPDMENHKLQTLMYALRLTRGKAHRASGDVETTVDLLRKIVEVSGLSLPQLAGLSMEPMFVETMPFGKHKGLPTRALPASYVDWALDNMSNMDSDLRHTFLTIRGKA